MAQAQVHRVGSAGAGELVHQALDGEDVHVRAQRTQGGNPHGRGLYEMRDHMPVGHGVEWNRVTIAPALRHGDRLGLVGRERWFDLPACQQGAGAAGTAVVAVAPDLIAPVDNVVLRIQRGLGLDRHSGPQGFPTVLLLAHPLHANGLARKRHGRQGRVSRDVVGAVVAIAARPLEMDASHILFRQLDQLREGALQRIDALAVGPDGQHAPVEPGDGAGRSD